VGVAEGDGAAVRAGGGVLGLCEFGEKPVDFFWVERLVDLDGGVAGHAGGDAAAVCLRVFSLPVAVRDGEDLFEHALELDAFEASRGGFDGEGAWAEGLSFEAVAVEFVGDLGEGDHLSGEEVDEQRHEEPLALDLLGVAFAQDLFEEDALVRDVLVDDPETFFVGGKNEGVAELAERLECGEGGEGVGLLGGRFVVCGFGVVVADGDGVAGKSEAAGGRWNDRRGEVEGRRFDRRGVEGFGVGCAEGFGLGEGCGLAGVEEGFTVYVCRGTGKIQGSFAALRMTIVISAGVVAAGEWAHVKE